MKKLLAFLLLAVCMGANAQFVPGQLLTAAQLNSQLASKAPIPTGTCLGSGFALNYNLVSNVFSCNGTIAAVTLNGNTFQSPGPIGSVSPSTGTFTNLTANGTLTFANGSLTLPYLATQAANTVVANVTAGSASPTAFAMPLCNASTAALQYATGGSGFICNTAINAATLGGATFASPGAIGSTTAGTGKFTTLQATSTITPSSTAGIVGTTTNDNANAGSVGEYVTATGSNTSLTSTVPLNATSISLTAGDWDVDGSCNYTAAGSTTTSVVQCGISTTSATEPANPLSAYSNGTFPTAAVVQWAVPTIRVSVASTTTVYLVVVGNFLTSTATGQGYIRARRVR